MIRVFERTSDSDSDFFAAGRELTQFRIVVHAYNPAIALVDFKAEVKHRNLVFEPAPSGKSGVIAFSGRVMWQHADTQAGLDSASVVFPDGLVAGGNILNITDHYGNIVLTGSVDLAPGYHRFSIWAYGGSSLAPGQDICCELSNGGVANPYNRFRVVVLDDACRGNPFTGE